MAIPIGSSNVPVPQDLPLAEPTAPAGGQDEAHAKAAQQSADKVSAQRQGVAEKSAEKAAEASAKAKGQTIDPATFKDLVQKNDIAALLEALVSASSAPAAPTSGADAALQALGALQPLLGKPNGLPVPDQAFDHPELAADAAAPGALSPAAVALLTRLAGQDAAQAGDAQSWLENVLHESGLASAQHMKQSAKAESIKQTIATIDKIRQLTEKLTQTGTTPPEPHLPASVMKVFNEHLPEIQAATKQLWQSMAKSGEDIEIPGEVVLKFEKAVMPTVDKYLELLEKLGGAMSNKADAQELAQALQGEPSKFAELVADLGLTENKGQKIGASAAWRALIHQGQQVSPQQESPGDTGSKGPTGSTPTKTTIGEAKTFSPMFAGLDFATADLESLIYFVLMQNTALEGDIMRDQMDDMRAKNEKKKEMREQLTKMKAEKAAAEKAMHAEYDHLVEQGAIDSTYTFDEYKTWRQITWTPEGDAVLAQPMPPLPDAAIFGTGGPPAEVDPTGHPSYPCDQELAERLAETFGVTAVDIAWLNSYFQYAQAKGDIPADLTFERFLTHNVKLNRRDPESNETSVQEFMTWIAENAPEFTDTAPVGEDGGTSSPFSVERYDELAAATDQDLKAWLGQALAEEPLASELKTLIDEIKAFTKAEDLGDAVSLLLSAAITKGGPLRINNMDPDAAIGLLANLANALEGKGSAGGEPLAMLLMLEKRKSLETFCVEAGQTQTFEGFSGQFEGASETAGWGSAAQQWTRNEFTTFYESLDWGLAADAYDALTGIGYQIYGNLAAQEPFAGSELIENILTDIKNFLGDDYEDAPLGECLAAFFAHGGLEDEEGAGIMARLVNACMDVSGNPTPPPKIVLQLLALEKMAVPEPEEGYWDPQYLSYDQAVTQFDDQALEGDLGTDEETPPAEGEEEVPPEDDPSSGSPFIDEWTAQREAEVARADAQEVADNAREVGGALGAGESLEEVPGKQTGLFTDMDIAIEKVQNEMDSLSELSDMDSMRLQMMMDRRQKLLETLSNTMKKMSATKELFIQNTKN